MIIIPAIDIKNGKCVRLSQGRMDHETIYSDDPSSMAERWENEGAELLHIVDLDGAISKKPENLKAIKKILNTVSIPIQLGGGIRNIETIEMLFDIGVSKVIIGTEAVRNPNLVKEASKKYPERIIVGIDAKNGIAAIEGWQESSKFTAIALAKEFENSGVAAINFTDISRDGMERGPNIEAVRILAESISIPVVASGGISNINDIKKFLLLKETGVIGIIIGKALYSGSIKLNEAIRIASE